MNQKKTNANEGNLLSLSAFNNISFLKTTVHPPISSLHLHNDKKLSERWAIRSIKALI
jgi:hypothetical protein